MALICVLLFLVSYDHSNAQESRHTYDCSTDNSRHGKTSFLYPDEFTRFTFKISRKFSKCLYIRITPFQYCRYRCLRYPRPLCKLFLGYLTITYLCCYFLNIYTHLFSFSDSQKPDTQRIRLTALCMAVYVLRDVDIFTISDNHSK